MTTTTIGTQLAYSHRIVVVPAGALTPDEAWVVILREQSLDDETRVVDLSDGREYAVDDFTIVTLPSVEMDAERLVCVRDPAKPSHERD